MSPLAEAVYAILRGRTSLADPRITYGELAKHLREGIGYPPSVVSAPPRLPPLPQGRRGGRASGRSKTTSRRGSGSRLRAQSRPLPIETITHRSQQLYAALCEVGDECRRLRRPLLPALVVRADTRRPGDAYYEGTCGGAVYKGEKVAAWRRELEAVKRANYPPRGEGPP